MKLEEKSGFLLHCVTSYPARIEEINLKAIETLWKEFKLPVGLSDHTTGKTASIAAAAIGACMIEKHFTLCRDLPGPDHKASLEPVELKSLIDSVRDTEKAMGSGIKEPTPEEEKLKLIVRRSIVASKEILMGSTITADMLSIKRPGTGIAPKNLFAIVGKKAKRDIPKDSLITWECITD